MSEAGDNASRFDDRSTPVGRAREPDSLVYHVRATELDVVVTPTRTGTDFALSGRIVPRRGRPGPDNVLVELMDPLGVVASTSTGGDFVFERLNSGVYNLRITGSGWKLGIFGLTG